MRPNAPDVDGAVRGGGGEETGGAMQRRVHSVGPGRRKRVRNIKPAALQSRNNRGNVAERNGAERGSAEKCHVKRIDVKFMGAVYCEVSSALF